MRILIAALALGALAACDGSVETAREGETDAAAFGYIMEVRASSAEQTYLITTPDGRTVGARAADGASAMMNEARAQALAANPPPEGEELPEVMSLRLPGFSMSIAGHDNDGETENSRVNLSIGAGRETVVVRADEGGPGDADDRAYVRISGADEDGVREFIEEQEELSPEVKAQLRAALGI